MKHSFLFFLMIVCFSCSKIEPRKPINPKPSTTLYFEAMQQNKILNKQEESKILNLIENDSLNTYYQSSNGFWYKYINKITEDLPTPIKGNEVTFQYNITDLKDSIIYSKEELGIKTYAIDKQDIISGLQKGIKLMKIGETITFVIPSYSAYGVAGDGKKIGINQSIKSTVTLTNIK
ncbi:gliding motility-associated peptidyl-prolyl isomerase GldI [Polaribacter vadi]|nr:gliding motility-associated peptidyl-prolyl isomerase GldI [Polaribacter vadi]